jgi:hypothetical protein
VFLSPETEQEILFYLFQFIPWCRTRTAQTQFAYHPTRPGASARARRPSSVAATASVRMGMRARRRALGPGTSPPDSFAAMPTRSLHARGVVAPGDTSRWPKSAGLGGHNALRTARRRRPVRRRRPAVRRRDRRRADGGARRGGRASRNVAGGHFTGMPTRSRHARGAGAPERYFRCPDRAPLTRSPQPDAGGPSRPRRP